MDHDSEAVERRSFRRSSMLDDLAAARTTAARDTGSVRPRSTAPAGAGRDTLESFALAALLGLALVLGGLVLVVPAFLETFLVSDPPAGWSAVGGIGALLVFFGAALMAIGVFGAIATVISRGWRRLRC